MLLLLGLLIAAHLASGFVAPRAATRVTARRMNFYNSSETSTEPISAQDIDIAPDALDSLPRVTWRAAAKGSVVVKESQRTVEEYMALPASQYSVLSAEQIQRLSDTEFKCTLPTMNFFGTKICPVLYVDVNVYPEDARSEIVVSRAETIGSDVALKVNGTFNISAVNTVTAGTDRKGQKTLNSDTNLRIDVVVPSTKLPIRVIQSGGNFLMQQSLNIIVPTFVRILRADFQRWSTGVNDRSAVEGATLG